MLAFEKIPFLPKMEYDGEWNTAITTLYDLWKKNKEHIKLNLRLIGECWYVLVFDGCDIEISTEEYTKFRNILIESTEHFIKKNVCIELTSSLVGYMISMFPYLFSYDDDMSYNAWSNIADSMKKNSYEIYKNNPLVRQIYYGGIKEYNENYMTGKKEAYEMAQDVFSNDTAIERYFLDVFSSGITKG